jgi:hypothetical protein
LTGTCNEFLERHVTLSNVLIKAAQGLTLAEKRIMSACIAQLDSKRMPDLYPAWLEKSGSDWHLSVTIGGVAPYGSSLIVRPFNF